MYEVATLSVQLALGSALVDWYRDAKSVPFGHLLIDLSPRTTIAYATAQRAEIFPQSFMYPTTRSIWNIWTMNTINLSTLHAFQHFSLACKFLKTCPRNIIRFLSDCILNLLQGKVSEVKRSHVPKYREKNHELFLKRTTWTQRRCLFSSEKKLLLIKTISPLVLIICLEMEQCVLVPLSVYHCSNNPTIVTKQELPKKTWPNSHVPQRYVKKENNRQLSTSASLLVNKILEYPRIKLSNSNTLILNGTETAVLLKDFAQRLRRKNVTVPDIYFTLLDAASITPDLVVNGHAKGRKGAWIPFKIWTTKVEENLHARICSIWFCAQFKKSSETLSVKGQRFLTFKDFIN